MKLRHFTIHHLLTSLMMILVVGTMTTLSSCGSDEPDWLVGYYLSINSQTRISLSEEDESQGTSSQPIADVLSNTIVQMRNALQEAYPEVTTRGDDAAVLTALDEIYMKYKTMYGGEEKNAVCIVKLYRASMDGEVVKKSTALKTYRFGARPVQFD